MSVVGYPLTKYKDEKAEPLKIDFSVFFSSMYEDCKTQSK